MARFAPLGGLKHTQIHVGEQDGKGYLINVE